MCVAISPPSMLVQHIEKEILNWVKVSNNSYVNKEMTFKAEPSNPTVPLFESWVRMLYGQKSVPALLLFVYPEMVPTCLFSLINLYFVSLVRILFNIVISKWFSYVKYGIVSPFPCFVCCLHGHLTAHKFYMRIWFG